MNRVVIFLLIFFSPLLLEAQWQGRDVVAARSGLPSIAYHVHFTPDGSKLVFGAADGVIRMVDVQTERLLLSFRAADTFALMPIDISSNGELVASGDAKGNVKVWRLATGELLDSFKSAIDPIMAVSFFPGGEAVAAWDYEAMVRVYDLATNSMRYEVGFGQGALFDLKVASNGKYLVGGNLPRNQADPFTGNGVRIWNAATGELLRSLTSSVPGSVGFSGFAVSRGGDSIALNAAIPGVLIWNEAIGKMVDTVRIDNVVSLEFTPRSDGLLAGKSYYLTLTSIPNGNLIKQYGGFHPHTVWVKYSPDGGSFVAANSTRGLTIWDTSGNGSIDPIAHRDMVLSIVLSPDGRDIVTAADTYNRVLDFRNAATLNRKPAAHQLASTYAARDLCYMQGGTHLIAGSGVSPIVYDLQKGKVDSAGMFRKEQRNLITALDYSPAGSFIATGGADSSAYLWRFDQRDTMFEMAGHRDVVTSVSIAPQGDRIATASLDGTMRIWGAATRKQLSIHEEPFGISRVRYSHDGRHLALAGDTVGEIVVLDTNGSVRHRLTGHEGGINAMIFSDDDRFLYSASDDGTIKVWDLAGGALLYTYERFSREQTALALLQDGRLVSGAADGTVMILRSYIEISSADDLRREATANSFRVVPNPTSSEGSIASLRLASAADVRIELHDLLGNRRATFLDRVCAPGEHSIALDLSGIASGAYLLHCHIGDRSFIERLVITR